MKNLIIEMARHGVGYSDIRKVIHCSARIAQCKVLGKVEFSISEALKIKDELFADCTLEYLFNDDDRAGASQAGTAARLTRACLVEA